MKILRGLCMLIVAAPVAAQVPDEVKKAKAEEEAKAAEAKGAPSLPAAVARAAEIVLSLEEKDAPGEWPYEVCTG